MVRSDTSDGRFITHYIYAGWYDEYDNFTFEMIGIKIKTGGEYYEIYDKDTFPIDKSTLISVPFVFSDVDRMILFKFMKSFIKYELDELRIVLTRVFGGK